MPSLPERTVSALRANHDDLTELARGLPETVLIGGSGAAEWTVADVLSHLGSGAEIATAAVNAALAGEPTPGQDANQAVWDRWNALGPVEQAAGAIEAGTVCTAVIEAITAEQLESTQIDLGFMPPIPLSTYLGMRLAETTLHGWDVAAGLDNAAELEPDAAAAVAEHYATGLGFLLGYTAKLDALPSPAVVDILDTPYTLDLSDGARLARSAESHGEPTATFSGPLAAAIRLLAGRLKPEYTPSGVSVDGNVTLDDLRATFPGY